MVEFALKRLLVEVTAHKAPGLGSSIFLLSCPNFSSFLCQPPPRNPSRIMYSNSHAMAVQPQEASPSTGSISLASFPLHSQTGLSVSLWIVQRQQQNKAGNLLPC